MGFLSWLSGGGSKAIGEAVKSASDGVRNIRNTFAKTLPPDEKAKFEMECARLESSLDKGQMEVNKVEAGHSSIFVAGWRPFLGWVLALGLAFQCLIRPILLIWVADIPSLPPAVTTLMTILLGGTVATRTIEKFKKVQNNH
jgi:hypothetical protein